MKSTDMIEKEFIIRKYPDNHIELQHSNGTRPLNHTDSSLIRKIDSNRIANRHAFFSQLNDNYFINVEFKKGILGYDFLD